MIVTSSDSHFPHDIGIYNDEIKGLLKRNGVDIVTFSRMKPIPPVPITAKDKQIHFEPISYKARFKL